MQVVTDPGGPRPSSWRSHRACLESVPDDATHLLVLQDDALPCDGYAAKAHAALQQHPGRVVCMFVPGFGHLRRRFDVARKTGRNHIDLPGTTFVPVVAIAYPSDLAREIPAFADSRRTPISRADDAVIAMYVRSRRVGAVATVPCLADHLDGEPSAMGYRPRPAAAHRVAVWFEG